jgi:hypothetical protein
MAALRIRALIGFVLALAAAGSAAAQEYTVDDLAGSYAYGVQADSQASEAAVLGDLGTLTFGTDGTVTGRRILRTFLPDAERLPRATLVAIQQQASGTYSMGPDGRGTATLAWTPPAPPYPRIDCQQQSQLRAEERVDFVMTGTGLKLEVVRSYDMTSPSAPPCFVTDREDVTDFVMWSGDAQRRTAPCGTASLVPSGPSGRRLR